MAEWCSLTYRQLACATEWYLGDEQLQAANDVLVDYLHQLQLAARQGNRALLKQRRATLRGPWTGGRRGRDGHGSSGFGAAH
jgi:hypothetical protein